MTISDRERLAFANGDDLCTVALLDQLELPDVPVLAEVLKPEHECGETNVRCLEHVATSLEAVVGPLAPSRAQVLATVLEGLPVTWDLDQAIQDRVKSACRAGSAP